MSGTKTVTSGFPLFSILGLIFITLKLTNQIGWSWWWVLSPFWIPLGIFFVIMVIGLIFFIVAKG